MMKRTSKAAWILWCGMASLAFGQKDATPPETFRPSYADGDWTRLSLRQDFVYRHDIKTTATEKTAATEIRDSQNMGFELVLRSLSKNADGSRDMEVEYRRKWRETWRDGGTSAVADYAPVVGKRMTFRLLADGTIEGVKGHESFPKIVDPSTGRAIDNVDFVHDIAHLFPKLPGKPISIGSTWEAPGFVEPGSSRQPSVYRYQVLNRVKKNGEDCLRILATTSRNQKGDRKAPDGTTVQIDNTSAEIVVYYFSLKRGMMVAKSHSWQGESISRGEAQVVNTKTLAMYECTVTFY
jgi:hypothetical protein